MLPELFPGEWEEGGLYSILLATLTIGYNDTEKEIKRLPMWFVEILVAVSQYYADLSKYISSHTEYRLIIEK